MFDERSNLLASADRPGRPVPHGESCETTEEIVRQMKLAMLCGRLNCALSGSDVWAAIPSLGECPTPAELVFWAAAETTRRMSGA